MKYTTILALAAASASLAFVVPDQIFAGLAVDEYEHTGTEVKHSIFSSLKKHLDGVADHWSTVKVSSSNALDNAFIKAEQAVKSASERVSNAAFQADSWIETELEDWSAYDHPPHHEPPHGRPRPPHHPHHPHHPHKPNQTVYELIAESKYTTRLAFLINQYDDLVNKLNSTSANYTVFAPTDKAFEKIPKHAKPSKEQIEKLLSYHVVPDFYPAGRVLVTNTVPTLLESDELGSEPLPQRLRLNVGLNGLTVNFYSHIVAVNIFGTNGVIHGVDSLILPPPRAAKIIDLLPSEFSTLELGLVKTGIFEKLNSTGHHGGTIFAPSNNAFSRLGPRINAFLFSERGLKYLKALLQYHIAPENTLYSDAFYNKDTGKESIPRGRFHADLPTLLEDRSLSIDIARFGGWITIKINGFSRVAIANGVARDGVIHVVGNVLIPPRTVNGEHEFWDGEELEVEDFMARLEPYTEKLDL